MGPCFLLMNFRMCLPIWDSFTANDKIPVNPEIPMFGEYYQWNSHIWFLRPNGDTLQLSIEKPANLDLGIYDPEYYLLERCFATGHLLRHSKAVIHHQRLKVNGELYSLAFIQKVTLTVLWVKPLLIKIYFSEWWKTFCHNLERTLKNR